MFRSFYTRWCAQQATIGETSGFEIITRNADRSHYYGLETELFWQATRYLELFSTVGLFRSEFDEFESSGEDSRAMNTRFHPTTPW